MLRNQPPAIPRLLITPGEPAGIGPDLLLQWFAANAPAENLCITAIADPKLLIERGQLLGLDTPLNILKNPNIADSEPCKLNVLPCSLGGTVIPGELNADNAEYVIKTLGTASKLCLQGDADAIVTGPVNKAVMNEGGIPFSGHTEYFAEQCAIFEALPTPAEPVMMLATPGLRVALVTTHLPLRKVADAICADKISYCLTVLHTALRDQFGIATPRILVAGLNPHAGEDGHLGHEENEIIIPVLQECRQAGMDIIGPLPADTLFTPKYLEQADAVLAMYHDQGLPVLKHLGFGNAVNITLGLPIIRTSVDHGTALDLAGTGKADIGSLSYAIEVAAALVRHNKAT